MARGAASTARAPRARSTRHRRSQAIEAKKQKVKASKRCPYCMGTGQIECASCLGAGVRTTLGGDEVMCGVCNGRGVHSCENCKGRGRFIPTLLDARISRDPESELEEVGLQ